MVVEMRSIEQIEGDYAGPQEHFEMTNDVLAQYWSDQRGKDGHGGGLGVLSVCSRWIAGVKVDPGDKEVYEAVLDMDHYIAWARKNPGPDVDVDEALAYRALLAAHWNEQFRKAGTKREDQLGPIEAVLS